MREKKREREPFSSSPQGVKRNTGSTVFGSVDLPEVTVMENDLLTFKHTHTQTSQSSILPSVYSLYCMYLYSIEMHLNVCFLNLVRFNGKVGLFVIVYLFKQIHNDIDTLNN